jgi:hypothetical protein
MTYVYIQTHLVGAHGVVPVKLEAKTFTYRFQARTWLVAHGYWMQDGNTYTNPYNGDTATLESRRTV